VADWLTWQPSRFTERSSWDLCLGERPAHACSKGWVEICLQRARCVAVLERDGALGASWLRRAFRPSWIVRLVSCASASAETGSWVLLVWDGKGAEQTRFEWLELGLAAGT
jgi:hypothetical protein